MTSVIDRRHRLDLMVLAALLVASLVTLPSACSGSTTQLVSASPTPDSITRKYVALVHAYHDQYVIARGASYRYCVSSVDPPKCRERGVAMVAVHDKFLKDLDTTPAPPQFAADDRAIRNQLPKAIIDLKKMVAAADAGNESAVGDAARAYISDMVPIVTDALHDIDLSWPKE